MKSCLPARPRAVLVRGCADPGERGLRTLDDHRDHLLGHVETLRPFGINLLDAAGLTLCESIVSDIDLPTYTAATAAGYAVRTSNLIGASKQRPIILPVVDQVEAGGYGMRR